ncbi:MAG: 50S ribosomal protein L4 [Spirochaetia bacterium]|nr:50S ribosomal protein L4 [Spirochaetia bacterium]
MSIQVFDFSGKMIGEKKVPDVFSMDVNSHLIWEVVTAEHANKRQGTHKTKEKGDVSGGGKKPWKQKGTGRARQGSIRAPQWKGGGTIFGPQPRSYRQHLSPRKKRAGMTHIIASKIAANQLVLLDKWEMEKPATAGAYAGFSNIIQSAPFFEAYAKGRKLRGKTNEKRRNVTIIVADDKKENKLSVKNIPWIQLLHVDRLATMPVFYNHGIIITNDAFEKLMGKLG